MTNTRDFLYVLVHEMKKSAGFLLILLVVVGYITDVVGKQMVLNSQGLPYEKYS